MNKTKHQSGFVHLAIIIILVLSMIGGLGYVGYINFVQNKSPKKVTNKTTVVAEKLTAPKDIDAPLDNNKDTIAETAKSDPPIIIVDELPTNVATGIIEGPLTFPSDFIPTNMIVYATNIETDKNYSTSEHITNSRFKYGKGYRLEVPIGKYYIFTRLGPLDGARSYYNQCMKDVFEDKSTCSGHDKIIVEVFENQTTTDIMAGN